jgi:hypothetical protein
MVSVTIRNRGKFSIPEPGDEVFPPVRVEALAPYTVEASVLPVILAEWVEPTRPQAWAEPRVLVEGEWRPL